MGRIDSIIKKELNIPEERTDSPLRIAQYYYDTFGKNQYTKKIEEIFFKKGLSKPNELHKLIEKLHQNILLRQTMIHFWRVNLKVAC